MRLRCGIGTLAIALAACGSSSAAPGSVSAPSTSTASHQSSAVVCGLRGAPTLTATRLARVYEHRGAVYGCAMSGGRSYLLGGSRNCIATPLVQAVALAGQLAAYGVERCGVDTGSAQVIVRRLSDGQQLRESSAITGQVGPESHQSVDSVVLRADGAVAWIVQADSIIRHSSEVEVNRADRRGEAQLDSGPEIAPRSLRLRGSTVTWAHSGSVRSATLL